MNKPAIIGVQYDGDRLECLGDNSSFSLIFGFYQVTLDRTSCHRVLVATLYQLPLRAVSAVKCNASILTVLLCKKQPSRDSPKESLLSLWRGEDPSLSSAFMHFSLFNFQHSQINSQNYPHICHSSVVHYLNGRPNRAGPLDEFSV